jgi:hypothetical protein
MAMWQSADRTGERQNELNHTVQLEAAVIVIMPFKQSL